jgi:hypothetical protein
MAVFVLAVAYQAAQRTDLAYATAQQALHLATVTADADTIVRIQAHFPDPAQKDMWHGMP